MSEWLERQPAAIQFVVLLAILLVPTILVPLAVELWG